MPNELWHSMGVPDVLDRLKTDPESGLTASEISARLERYGPNELKKEDKASPFSLFLNQFKNTLIIILLVAVVLSVFVGEVFDAILIAVIVIFSALLGFFQEYKAEKALEALKKMLSPTITVLRDGREDDVPSKGLVPGDILLLEAGDKLPADGRLIEVRSLKCDEASLTGESIPVSKDTAPLDADIAAGDRKNMVFAGTIVSYGRAKAVVTSTGMKTEFGVIAGEVTAFEHKKTPLEKRTEEIGKWLGIVAFGICLLVAGFSTLREALVGRVDMKFLVDTLMFAVALAVAAVPEALTAIVTGALAIGMHQMAKSNALVRKMPAVETLGCATVICSDKTGTLTKGEMTVRRVYVDGAELEVTGTGYEPAGEFKGAGVEELQRGKAFALFLKAGLLCNDSSLDEVDGKWAVKGDPTEGALVVLSAKAGMHPREYRLKNPRLEELPFSSERKRMTTLNQDSSGKKIAFMKGAPEVVLKRCYSVLEHGESRVLSEEDRLKILKANESMANHALRVLGFAYKELGTDSTGFGEEDERDMVFLGLSGMMDPPRPEAIESVRVCNQMKIKCIMITGDHEVTARAVASEIGIYREGDIVLTGHQLEKMSETELEKIVDRVTVYARVSPIDKLKIVKAWKNRGEVVAMTGDGVNDAPALKQADIGIAMGITGTEVTKDAADLVLSDDNFATILKAIERGRWIYDNIKKYLTYLLRCNVTEVVVIGGIVLIKGPDYLPLLSAAILYINLATDGLPALALGIAPPDPDILQRPPRNPKESVFSREVLTFIIMAQLIQTPFFYALFFHDLGNLAVARTEIFFAFILMEMAIAFNFRSLRFSVLEAPPHRWLVLAVLSQVVILAGLIQIPSIRESFGIIMPSFNMLALILGFSAFVFLAMEITKAFFRRRFSQGNERSA